MTTHAIGGRVLAAILVTASAVGVATARQAPARVQIVIVVDGLRPDQVTAAQMPRLHALAARGIRFTAHHSVFPTVTRVNAATFATGVWPARHGLLGNTIYVPSVDPVKTIDTADYEALLRVAASDGQLLTAPTIGQMLERAGRRFLVVSSGSSGSALLLSPTCDAGVILHTEFARPEAWHVKAVAALGPTPAPGLPNAARNRYATDLLLRIGLPDVRPDVAFVWYSDPDTTAHARGLDAPATRESLTAVDKEIGRIEDWLRAQGRLAATNFIVTSDHGFSTHTGGFDLPPLVKPFVRPMPDGTPDLVTAGGAIHFRGARDEARVSALVEALQQAPAAGAIFTAARAPGELTGRVAGTLSFDSIGWAHPRSGEILVSATWAEGDGTGLPGTASASGRAGHGSTSRYEIANTLMAAGPDFRESATSATATGNVDITPTLLRLAGVVPPGVTFDGRVIEEALRTWPSGTRSSDASSTVAVDQSEGEARYTVEARVTVVSGVRYLDAATATRRSRPKAP